MVHNNTEMSTTWRISRSSDTIVFTDYRRPTIACLACLTACGDSFCSPARPLCLTMRCL